MPNALKDRRFRVRSEPKKSGGARASSCTTEFRYSIRWAEIETSAADAKENVRSGWADLKNRIEERLTATRTKLQERKAERDVNRAERRAQDAEDDAANAIAFAVYILDQAEYAVVDAALARAAADDLRAAA